MDTITVNGPEDVLDWDAVVWRTHEDNVARLRRRIFTETREQDWATVRSAGITCSSRISPRTSGNDGG